MNGSSSGGSNSHSAPELREGDRECSRASRTVATAPRAAAPRTARRTRSRCRRARPPARARAPARRTRRRAPSAGSARLPTITGWTNSTATWRTSERRGGRAPSGDQSPAAGEPLGHPVAEAGDPLRVGARRTRHRRACGALEQRPAAAARVRARGRRGSHDRRHPRCAPARRATRAGRPRPRRCGR